MQENIKQVIVKNTVRKEFKTAPIWQWDTGHVLVFEGFDLPEAFQVHFAFSESGESVPQIGSNDQVTVPDALVEDGRTIYAWLYISTEDAGLTKFLILMPVNRRAKPTHQVPPPVEQSEIDQAIAALNTGVARAETAAENAETAEENASQYAENAYNSSEAAASAAESAEGDARTATQKAQEALTAALDADRKAQNASESAQLASQKASDASGFADNAQGSAQNASNSAQSAQGYAQTAGQKATEATRSAENAVQKAQEALSSAQAAEGSANDADTAKRGAESARDAAQGYAGNASMMAQEATQSKNTAVEKAGEAEQSASAAAQSAQAAQQTAQQFSAKISEIDQELNTLSGDVSDLSDSLSEHEQYAEDTYAKQDGYYSDLTAGNAEQLVSSKLTEDQVPYKLRPAGGTNDIGNREYKEAIVGGTIAWNQLVRDEASDNETDYADVVIVDDAVEDAAGVKVKLEPVQDLHGYSNPWPGGGSKNLLDSQVDTTGYIRGSDGEFVSGAEAWKCSTVFSPILPNTDYVLYKYATATSSVAGYAIYDENKNYIDGHAYVTGTTVSITTPQNARYIRASWGSNVATPVALMLASETDATYEPYSNICPITGWNGVKVTRTGKNLLGGETLADDIVSAVGVPSNTYKGENADGKYVTFAAGAVIAQKPITGRIGNFKVNTVYTLIFKLTRYQTGNNLNANIGIMYTDGTDRTIYFKESTETETVTVIYKTLSDKTIEYVHTNWGGGRTYLFYEESGIFEGDISADDFEPYSGQTYEVSLPTEAGTVYGGELTVNADGSGSLVVDRARAKISDLTANGGLIVGTYTAMRRFFLPSLTVAVAYNQKHGAIGSMGVEAAAYYGSNRTSDAGSADVDFGITASGDLLAIYDTDLTLTSDAFMEKYGDAVIVYPLATPQTYALTASQIRTLLGTNNVWADSGDVALTYTGTDEHLTLTDGRKYLTRISGTDSMVLGAGQSVTAVKGQDNVFDLTQMFGTSVADYVYGQGAGYFRKWFMGAVYAYNPGTLISVSGLQSHDTVGFNQWDEEWEVGAYSSADGTKVALSDRIRSKNKIKVLPETMYAGKIGLQLYFYDADHNFLTWVTISNGKFRAPTGAKYVTFNEKANSGTTYNHDICISLANNGSRNGEYEPYQKHSYPLDSSVILRGIPKTGSNGVYWDGDRYLPDGTIDRRYGVVEMGQFRWMEYSGYPGLFYINVTDIPFKVPASNTVIPNAVMAGYQSFISRDIGKTVYTKGYFALAANRIYVADDTYTGDTSGFKAAMQDVLLVYELAEPTTETADPYRELQIVDDWGTEEFVTTGLVPVGHETQYPANLRDKLQHLPDLASSNGIYIVKQTDSEMELLKLPDMPTTNGNYRLKLNVASGSPTFSWEVVS